MQTLDDLIRFWVVTDPKHYQNLKRDLQSKKLKNKNLLEYIYKMKSLQKYNVCI